MAASLPAAGCGGVEVQRLREDVEIDLSEFPELDTVGRTVLVELAALPVPLALTRDGDQGDAFIVTGTECNHFGCGVVRDGGGWRCPCHGARFGLDGSLQKGPATEDLVAYEYEVVDSMMTVFGYD